MIDVFAKYAWNEQIAKCDIFKRFMFFLYCWNVDFDLDILSFD